MDDYSNPNKVYVDVLAVFSRDGSLRPIVIVWEDERRYAIDKITDIRQAASLKAGGTGIRYTIKIGRTSTYLFFENNRWFVERK